MPFSPSQSWTELVELTKKLRPPDPILLLTDSLETLRTFADQLRHELLVKQGAAAAARVEVVVTRRDGLPDLVRLGSIEVIIDPRAPAEKVFKLQLPPSETLPRLIAFRHIVNAHG